MNRFMPWLRHHDAINVGGEIGFHTAWDPLLSFACRAGDASKQTFEG